MKGEKMFHDHCRILIPKWIWDSKDKDEFKTKLSKYMRKNYPEVTRVIKVEKPFVIVERGGRNA